MQCFDQTQEAGIMFGLRKLWGDTAEAGRLVQLLNNGAHF